MPLPRNLPRTEPPRIVLPPWFTATHPTGGLPGYPAIDIFGPPGALVESGFWGIVRRISGRPCSAGGASGGSYGQSLYVLNTVSGVERFVTHLDALRVELADRVKPGTIIGRICDSRVSGKPGTSHAHLGVKVP